MELVGIDNTHGNRAEFVFTDPAKCEKLAHLYSFAGEESPDVTVDARKFVTAVRLLKEKLYQEKNNR
jgi:hypothetical protein